MAHADSHPPSRVVRPWRSNGHAARRHHVAALSEPLVGFLKRVDPLHGLIVTSATRIDVMKEQEQVLDRESTIEIDIRLDAALIKEVEEREQVLDADAVVRLAAARTVIEVRDAVRIGGRERDRRGIIVRLHFGERTGRGGDRDLDRHALR